MARLWLLKLTFASGLAFLFELHFEFLSPDDRAFVGPHRGMEDRSGPLYLPFLLESVLTRRKSDKDHFPFSDVSERVEYRLF